MKIIEFLKHLKKIATILNEGIWSRETSWIMLRERENEEIEREDDIVSQLRELMEPYGEYPEEKMNNRTRPVTKIITVVLVIYFTYSVITTLVPSKYAYYLAMFSDYGVVIIGLKYRQVMNGGVMSYLSGIAGAQLNFTFDDLSWLKKANQLFRKIDSIYISSSIKRIVKRSHFNITLVGYLYGGVYLAGAIYNPYFRGLLMENVPWFLFGFSYYPITLRYVANYAGVFVYQLYYLLKMSNILCDQFNRNLKKRLRNKRLSEKMLMRSLEEYSNLVAMLQYITVGLRRLYVINVSSVFGFSFCFYYLSFPDDAPKVTAFTASVYCSVSITFVLFISSVAGGITKRIEKTKQIFYEHIAIRRLVHGEQFVDYNVITWEK